MSKGKRTPEAAALANLPARSGYAVGYGKPPEHTRFQKGRSGNPKGRPKGAKGKVHAPHAECLKEIVLEEAYRTISVRDGLRDVKVPIAQAVIRSLAVNAVKGHGRAQRLFTELLTTTEREKHRLHEEWLDGALSYKLAWERELERCRLHGIVAPEPLPHPDHIRIDFRTSTGQILGPLTNDEQADLDVWREHKVTLEDELSRLLSLLEEGCEDMPPEAI